MTTPLDPILISRMSMAAHMEFETQLPDDLCARIIGVFTMYWRRRINLDELQQALRLAGYGRDLTDDGFHQFLNAEDIH